MAKKHQKRILNYLFTEGLPSKEEIDLDGWNVGLDDLENNFEGDIEYYNDGFKIEGSIKKAQENGFDFEKKGFKLYTVTDDPDYVVYIAMKPEYHSFVNMFKRYFGFEFVDRFNAVDLVDESE